MRMADYAAKGKPLKDFQVNECSRFTVNGVENVAVYQVDDQGKRIKLLKKGTDFKIKLNEVDAIDVESKDGFNWVLEGPDPLDTTPLEVPVEKPLTQTQQLRMWLQNEQNIKQDREQELTWEEFQDLGNMDEADDFYKQFGQEGMTKYEMQAEALRQHANPLRGMDLNEENRTAAEQHHGSGEDDQPQSVADSGTQTGGETPTEGGESSQ